MDCYPIVSLDKIYLNIDNENIIFLDCTRLNNSKELVSRNDYNNAMSVKNQIRSISNYLQRVNCPNIVLADDVVFSGSVLNTITSLFAEYGIKVVGIRCGICSAASYQIFNETCPLKIKSAYLMDEKVIDQICERDFYFGIAGSGISTKSNNKILKSPYFLPYGDPVTRASVPKEDEQKFSNGCLKRSISLWKEIERLSNQKFFIKDLPEEIIDTNGEEEIVKTLKKGIK